MPFKNDGQACDRGVTFEPDDVEAISHGARQLVQRMLRKDPVMRPSSGEVLQSEFFSSTDAENSPRVAINSEDFELGVRAMASMNRLQKKSLYRVAYNSEEAESQKFQ